jgi:hypothetical protein
MTLTAAAFFDPIVLPRFGEDLIPPVAVNNPVREVWEQAQMVWGPEPLESTIKCLVSIGAGILTSRHLQRMTLSTVDVLVANTMAAEATAEYFLREKFALHSTGKYYRFNVVQGLDDIAMEERSVQKIAAVTRQYVTSREVFTQMRAFASMYRRLNWASSDVNSLRPVE